MLTTSDMGHKKKGIPTETTIFCDKHLTLQVIGTTCPATDIISLTLHLSLNNQQSFVDLY